MEQKNHTRIAGMGDRVTSTISVTLVLFILGLVAAINITFSNLDKELKEKIGFTVVLHDSIPAQDIEALLRQCDAAPYISDYKYLSAEDALMEETAGDGQELVEMLGVNPYSPMLDIRVKSPWANVDSISGLVGAWGKRAEVAEVSVNTDVVKNLDSNARMFSTILLVIAAVLLLITFVLINNTVRLTVYSRRFTIHTMKLVGATGGFIRRPFLISNLIQGIIAAIIASGLLGALFAWGKNWNPSLGALLPWSAAAVIFGIILITGMAICTLAAVFATNRYLRADYDEMFD